MKQNLIRVHSCYSILDGLNTPEELAKRVSELEISTYLPITELCNVSSVVKHYRACKKYNLKPIYGADVPVEHVGLVTLFAKNKLGLENINRLLTSAQMMNESTGEPMLFFEDLLEQIDSESIVLFLDQEQLQHSEVTRFQSQIDDLCLYVKLDVLKPYNESAIANYKVIPSVDVFFENSSDKTFHDIRVAIQESVVLEEYESRFSSDMSLHTEESFELLLNLVKGVPFTSIEEVYAQCEFELDVDITKPPQYPFTGDETQEEFLKRKVYEGFEKQKEYILSSDKQITEQLCLERIEYELDVVQKMGFAGYFLIVWDYINWSKDNNIAVGAGRGSGAGSFIALLLNIVEINALAYDLLFERFLNPERVSMPDFDTDFDTDKRGDVIEYTKNRFGQDYATQICTFGRMRAKAVVKDVGRVLQLDVDAISKSIPEVPEITMEQAERQSKKFKEYRENQEYSELFKFADKLEGLPRSVGRHAGGVVISNGIMFGYTGFYVDSKGNRSVMLDMNDSEAVGLVKFDFLGLGNISVITKTVNKLKSQGVDLDIARIDLEDQSVYKFLSKALTQGVFQLHSAGMRALIKRLKPDCFEDMIALVALFRPGPLQSGMVDNFVERKHGLQEVAYPDHKFQLEMLKEILHPTYGIILYQEQVMQIAQEMASYSLGKADLLRRAMGKKKPEEMDKQKATFIDGSVNNNVDKVLAEKIFDLVEKFSGYGFNKSHSAAYGFIAYQTAYLKTHYTSVFMAEVLSYEKDNHNKLAVTVNELSALGLSILPPNVNVSGAYFEAVDENTISYGLSAMKSIGVSFAEELVAERLLNGDFTSVSDFRRRMDGKVNKTQISALIFGGCFDGVTDYAECLDFLNEHYDFEKTKYAVSTDEESIDFNQKKLCGISFKLAKVLASFSSELQKARITEIAELDNIPDGTVVSIGGIASGVKVINGKVRRLVGELRDTTGAVDLVGWEAFQNKYGEMFGSDDLYIVQGKVGSFNDKKQLNLFKAFDKNFVRDILEKRDQES